MIDTASLTNRVRPHFSCGQFLDDDDYPQVYFGRSGKTFKESSHTSADSTFQMGKDFPVDSISWNDARSFIKKLSATYKFEVIYVELFSDCLQVERVK